MVKLYWISEINSRQAIMARPRGADWLETEIKSLRSQSVDVVVSLLTDDEVEELELREEAQQCATHGIEYVRFPIEDRSVPSDLADFNVLLKELDMRLAEKKAIAIHCRMGIGRSSLVAACLLRQTGLTTARSFELIEASRGCAVPDTQAQFDWVDELRLT